MPKRNYRIDIYIKNDGDIEAKEGSTEKKEKVDKYTTGYVTYKVAQPILNGALQGVKNYVDIMYSNTELSQRVGIGIQAVNEVQNVVGKVAGGMTLATALGFSVPIAGTIAMATSIMDKVINIALKQQQIMLKSVVENEQHNILISRMGTQYNNSRR